MLSVESSILLLPILVTSAVGQPISQVDRAAASISSLVTLVVLVLLVSCLWFKRERRQTLAKMVNLWDEEVAGMEVENQAQSPRSQLHSEDTQGQGEALSICVLSADRQVREIADNTLDAGQSMCTDYTSGPSGDCKVAQKSESQQTMSEVIVADAMVHHVETYEDIVCPCGNPECTKNTTVSGAPRASLLLCGCEACVSLPQDEVCQSAEKVPNSNNDSIIAALAPEQNSSQISSTISESA